MKTRHILMILTFVAGMWGGTQLFNWISDDPEGRAAAQAMVNKKIPDFTLPDLDGRQHNIHEWDGNVIVLNFWATWCPPCIKETPMFVEMQEQFGDKGLQFIGVAIDEKQQVLDFMDSYGVNYPMLIGTEDAIKVAEQFGNRFGALPWTVVVDRSGTIVHAQGGEFTRQKAEAVIKPLL